VLSSINSISILSQHKSWLIITNGQISVVAYLEHQTPPIGIKEMTK